MDYSILAHKRVLITAGPTKEAIDPVRYVSNHSTGKMGFVIAEKLLELGAEVTMISGPVNIHLQHPKLKIVKINSASEMYLACCKFFEEVDIAVFAAAVADYRPVKIAEQKIKKDEKSFTLKMVKNVDIAYEFGKVKKGSQISVGFALETTNEIAFAKAKLQKKNLDMVVLNSMNDSNAGFGFDTNKVTIIKKDHSRRDYSLKQKTEVARDIAKEISSLLIKQYQFEPMVCIERS